ncbi:MAG TPA: hypothetical protein VG815_14300, partial [Chloroflexota bacterium]|jgi:Zn-dependent protease|nr:hypothetical protein [Chloroflexota bacterium]
VNLALFVFNLIPLPPLDGFTILSGFLTTRQLYSLAPLIQYGPMILLLLVAVSATGNLNILGNTVFKAVYHLGGIILPAFPAIPVCSSGPGY